MAYSPQPVDIPIYGLNQVPPGRAGPSGRLLSAKNAQVRRFVAAQQTIGVNTPAQIQLDPRDGLVSFPAAARSVVDGAPTTLSWNTPQLLDSLGDQLISIVGGSPRVRSSVGWTAYPNNTIVPHTLSQDVWHTSQGIMQAPDYATCQGTTCAVWTQVVSTDTGPSCSPMIGFTGEDGSWLVQPTTLLGFKAGGIMLQAKVVTDGSHFFVFFNDVPANTQIFVFCYDTNGNRVANSTIPCASTVSVPGCWDVVPAVTTGGNAGTIIFAQCISTTTDAGVAFTSVGFASSAITLHLVNDAGIHCQGRLAWVRNDLGNGLAYLATATTGTFTQAWGYEITQLAHTHEYNTGDAVRTLDSISGFAFTDGSGVGLVLSLGSLPAVAATTGPLFDPQTRRVISVQVTRAGVSSILRNTQGVAQVSRAFPIDGNYYTVGYYQSGSGTTVTPRSAAVTHTAGDFMLGAAVQPVVVAPGDFVEGNPITTNGPGGNVFPGQVPTAIGAGDKVEVYTVVAGDALNGVGMPIGTNVLKWTLGGLNGGTHVNDDLTITACSELTAIGTWAIFETATNPPHTHYTPLLSTTGQSVNPATFTSGSFTIFPNFLYQVPALQTLLPDPTQPGQSGVYALYTSLTWSGAPSGDTGENGTFAIKRFAFPNVDPNSGYYNRPTNRPSVVVAQTTQAHATTVIASRTAVVSPTTPQRWHFANLIGDASYVGSNLVVSGDGPHPENNVDTPITSVSGTNVVTADLAPPSTEFFTVPLPSASVDLAFGQVPYTFSLQALFGSINYTYQNALVSVQGSPETGNNGVYQIQTINADGTFIAIRTDGTLNQVNEAFSGAQTITIFFAANISPIVQATWFLVPLTGTQPIAGRWEYGSAYADWRIEGDSTLGPNLYPMALSSPAVDLNGGVSFALPFRAQNVTVNVPLVSSAGQVPFAEEITGNTVGLKVFTIGSDIGQSFENTTTLMIPGPLSVAFTKSGFFEAGIGLAPEPPFLVSQSVASSPATLGLQLGATYIYQLVSEVTDENGDLIESIPSQIFTVTMSGTNNVATLGGRLQFPLDTDGTPKFQVYGPLTRNVTLSLYRTAIVGGIPTTQKYKITNDLSPNQLAPVSSLNPSGFSFPDSSTWNYVDCNPDIGLPDNQDIYTDGELPRYAPPPFSRGIGNYLNRDWALAYDGSVWMSAEHFPGQAVAWNPAWRWQFPSTDKPKTIGVLENSMFVFCERAIYQIPLGGASLPPPKGGGNLPTPVLMRWPNGSKNGFALSIPNLVVYDSTAGGVWAINESLENVWLSHPVIDDLVNDVCGLAIDADQKLYIQQIASPLVLIYDHVAGVWGGSVLPTQPVLIGSNAGRMLYQDTAVVSQVVPNQTFDLVNGVIYGIPPDITFASVSFASVRGLKMIWGLQMIGQYLGAHRINIVITYPDDGYPDQIVPPFTPKAGVPYVIPFYLMNEEVTSFGLRIYADFVGVTNPAGSFSLELLAAEVGVETGGLAKLKDSAAAV